MAVENGQKEPHSAVIHFVPTTCAVAFIDHAREKSHALVSMDLKVASDTRVRAPDGRSLNGIAWSIQLYDSSSGMNEEMRARGAIGVLQHRDVADRGFETRPESGYVLVAVPPELFRVVEDLALYGKSPSSINVTAAGLQYGSSLDEGLITWDTKKFECGDIIGIDVVVGTRADDDPVVNYHKPVEVGDLREVMRNATTAITHRLDRLGTLLGLLLVASIAILLIILLRR